MAGFNVQEFRANGLKQLGARPTQFHVDIFPPFASQEAPRMRLLVRAASIPTAPLDIIPVPYFGRKIKVPGDREFPDWTVTILNDEDFAMRKILEKWSNQMNALISNRMDPAVYPQGFKSSALVTQYTKIGSIARQYELQGIWPSVVDQIPLDWDATNQIEQFDTTFAVDQWVPVFDGGFISPDDYNPVLNDDGLQT